MNDSSYSYDFQHSPAYILHALVMMMDRYADAALQAELDITYSQFLVLMVIEGMDQPAPSQQVVATCLGVTPSAISRQIDVLCDRELITRAQHSESRREHVLGLTAKGLRLTEAARTLLSGSFDSLAIGIEASHMQVFQQTLATLLAKMNAKVQEPSAAGGHRG